MKTLSFLLLFLLLWALNPEPAQAQDYQNLTISDAINLALENNQQIRDADYDVRAAGAAIRESQTRFLPNVDISGQYTNNVKLPVIFLPPGSPFGDVLEVGTTHNMNLNAQVAMPLYNRAVITGVSLARANEALVNRMRDATEKEVIAEVQRAYLNVLLTGESLEALQTSLDRREMNLELVKSLHEEQMVPEFDLIRTNVQVENIKPQLRALENAHKGAKNYLKLLTGIDIRDEIALSEELEQLYERNWKATPSDVMSRDLSGNPNLLQQQARIGLTQQQHQMNRAAYFPSVSLVGVNTHQAQGNELQPFEYDWIRTTYFGVNVSVPLFSGFERNFQNQQTRIQLRQQEAQLNYLADALAMEHLVTSDRMQHAREAIDIQDLNRAQAERGYEIARTGYENGTQSLIEVNDAELATTDARLNYLQSLFDYIDAIIELEQILGLNPSIEL